MQTQFVMICSRDFWFRPLGADTRVWALIDAFSAEDIMVYLINGESAIIASRQFRTRHDARETLRAEGYVRLLEDRNAQATAEVPDAPFYVDRRMPAQGAAAPATWSDYGYGASYA